MPLYIKPLSPDIFPVPFQPAALRWTTWGLTSRTKGPSIPGASGAIHVRGDVTCYLQPFAPLFSPDWTKRLQVTSLAQQNWGEGGSSRFVPLWKDRILPGRQSPPWNPWIKKSSPLTPPPSPEMSYSRAPVKTGFLNLAHHRSFSLAAPCAPECCSSHVSVFHTYMRVHAGPSLVSVFHTSVPRLVLCRCFPQVDSTRLLFIMKLLNIYCSYPLWFAQGILYPSSPGRKWNHVPVGTSRDRLD